MRGKSAAPFLVLFKGFSIMFGLFLSQFFVFLHGSLRCTHLNLEENTAKLTPRGSEVCAPRQKCATHRSWLVSAATICPYLFLLFTRLSSLYPLYTSPIPTLCPGNSPAFMLVPWYPAINPLSAISHLISSSIHQCYHSPDLHFPGATAYCIIPSQLGNPGPG